MSRTIKLAAIPGDGIGPEVVAEALRVLDAVTARDEVTIETTMFHLGATRFLETGDVLTDSDLESIKQHDAILLGAVGGVPGDPRLLDANIERGLLLGLRFALDHYVNRRPCTIFPGVTSPLAAPGAVDFVVVREGTEGPYVGNGGAIRRGTPQEVANEVSVNTAYGVERVVRYAFEVALEYPQVAVDYLHVDAATIFFVTNPSRFDVLVTDNLFGDILTDLAAAISGGIGLAASGNINPTGRFPSMFEPVHGSAPDIAGQQLADPTAAILSVALLLDHLGLTDAASRVNAAVADDLSRRATLGRRSTAEVGDAIVTLLTDKVLK